MQNHNLCKISRNFYANDWNQPASLFYQINFLTLSPFIKNVSIFFSNAEKMRKINYPSLKNNLLEQIRTNWSIGLQILFSLIPYSFNLFKVVR